MEEAAPATALVVSSAAIPEQHVQTPLGVPNVVIKVVSPLAAVFVRAGKAYLQTLVGLLGAAGFGITDNVLSHGDFWQTFGICASLSVASFVMSCLTNLTILLSDLGDRFPILRA